MVDKKKSNGAGADGSIGDKPKPAPRGGPPQSIRFRSREEKRAVTRAAKAAGVTLNTWMVETLSKAAEEFRK
jgi:hypothetical protein